MTAHVSPPPGIPCAVCLARVDRLDELDDGQWRADPCGHTTDEMLQVWAACLPEAQALVAEDFRG